MRSDRACLVCIASLAYVNHLGAMRGETRLSQARRWQKPDTVQLASLSAKVVSSKPASFFFSFSFHTYLPTRLLHLVAPLAALARLVELAV